MTPIPLSRRLRGESLRAKVRRRTWVGLGAIGVLALVFSALLYLQQRAVVIESHLLRQDRMLEEVASGLRESQERQIRLAGLMSHVVRNFPRGSSSRARAWSLLSSDSTVTHLSLVHPRWARLLWSRGESQPWLAHTFYNDRRGISVSDLEAPPPGRDSTWDAVLSVRVKDVFPGQELELSTTGEGIAQTIRPVLLNRGLSLGLVNSRGQWFPIFDKDSARPAVHQAVPLSAPVLRLLRDEPRGLLWRGPGGEGDPIPRGSLVHARAIGVWGGLRWILVLHLPRREITAPLLAQFGWSLALLGLFVAMWGSLAWYLVRRDLRIVRLQDDNDRLRELRNKEEQLVQAEKLATVGVLVSGFAHEIGTPLGVVSMRLQLLRRRTAEDSDERRTMDVALEQLERVTGLIRQLLDFARSKPGVPQAVDLRATVGSVLSLVEPLAARKRASLAGPTAEGDLPSVAGVPDALQQVVLNLVMNALQAIPEEGNVQVGLQAEGGVVILSVEDDGPGIPEERRAAIFDPFFTTKPQGEGSGLGLSVVLGLVTRMHGEMAVGESSWGGARFTVRLPAWEGR